MRKTLEITTLCTALAITPQLAQAQNILTPQMLDEKGFIKIVELQNYLKQQCKLVYPVSQKGFKKERNGISQKVYDCQGNSLSFDTNEVGTAFYGFGVVQADVYGSNTSQVAKRYIFKDDNGERAPISLEDFTLRLRKVMALNSLARN